MQARVSWQQDLLFDCQVEDTPAFTLDGSSMSLSPMHAVLAAVGACSSVDVVEILKKARQDLQACECELRANRADSAPRVFTDIHAHYQVKGANISIKHLERAIQLSTEKYCSVMLMLNKTVNITTSYEII